MKNFSFLSLSVVLSGNTLYKGKIKYSSFEQLWKCLLMCKNCKLSISDSCLCTVSHRHSFPQSVLYKNLHNLCFPLLKVNEFTCLIISQVRHLAAPHTYLETSVWDLDYQHCMAFIYIAHSVYKVNPIITAQWHPWNISRQPHYKVPWLPLDRSGFKWFVMILWSLRICKMPLHM